MKKTNAVDPLDQTEEYDEDKKLISEDQLYPTRIQTPLPDGRSQLPSAVELQNKGQFDVIDIIEESQNTLGNPVLIDQTGMSPYDSRDDNSRMQSAEGARGDPRFKMRKVKHQNSNSYQSEQQELITQINVTSKEIMLPGENMTTTLDQHYFMKPGLAKSATEAKKLQISERPPEFQHSEEINFQTSEALLNDPPVTTKRKRKERHMEETDSDELESNLDDGTVASTRIEDHILKVATRDLSEPNIQLSAFFDEEGIQKSMCRNIIQHPEKDQMYAASGEFGNELRLFDIKNIEKGNHRFECMMRRVNICPTDLKNEQSKMRINLSEAFSFFRIVYDALQDQVPDTVQEFNQLRKKIDGQYQKKPDPNKSETYRSFKLAKNKLRDIYINSFCLLGDEEGHIVVGLNSLQKAVLLKPTESGPYKKIDEINFNLTSLDKKMSIMQIEAVSDCYEVSHDPKIRKEYQQLLKTKQDELDNMNADFGQKQTEYKKTKFELKRKYQEMYYKVFMLHKCPLLQTVKLTYHLISVDQDGSENDGEMFFVKEEKYPDIYKVQNEERYSVQTITNRIEKNCVDLRVGSSHFIINQDEGLAFDSSKQELIVCVKEMGNIFKSCFEVRRFEDLSVKRHVKSDFSASCILKDQDDLHCLTMSEDRKVKLVRASFGKFLQNDSDRDFSSDQACLIKEAEECFDGIFAEQIVSAGPYIFLAAMQKLTVVEKKLNKIVMQAETMGRIKCMSLARNLKQLFIQTEDNYLYCIMIESISQIKYLEEGGVDEVAYQRVAKVIATYQNDEEQGGVSTIKNILIAKGKQIWLQDKYKIYQETESIAYLPAPIKDIAIDRDFTRIFILDERLQLYVYICQQNSFRHLMGFEHSAKMEMVYMPKHQKFDRTTMRIKGSIRDDDEKGEEEVHILVTEGEDDDIQFYRLHVPNVDVLIDIHESVKYGIYDQDQLRYWGPIKYQDIFKVVSVCYFDSTIFVLFQSQERDTKFLRRFDEYFERQEEVKQDFRQLNKQIEDYQLEDEAYMTQTGIYLILSYRNKTEFILADSRKRRRINVFRTVDTEFMEQGFVVLSYFDGAIVASISQEGHYVVFRDIDQNQVIMKQELNFIPQQILIDEQLSKVYIKECYQTTLDMRRMSKDFRQSFIKESMTDLISRRSSVKDKMIQRNNSFKAVQSGNGLGRIYEFGIGVLLSKKNRDRQYNSLKKEMLRYQLHHATEEERTAYLLQENQFYTMIKMTANFVTITSCLGNREREMQQAISLGVPILNDTSGKSPLHFAKLMNNMISLNLLVEQYQKNEHYTPINLEDRDFLIQAFQSNWKDMFCFTKPIYFKEAQKLIANGFHGVIKPGKEIIYTEDSEISKTDIINSVIIDYDEDHEFTDTQTIQGQTLRVKLNMQIETETCYNFLKLVKNANSELLELSDLEIIIKHSFQRYYKPIVFINMIHLVQAFFLLLHITTESSYLVLLIILAVLILFMQVNLVIKTDDILLKNKMRLCSILGNLLVIMVNLVYMDNPEREEYKWDTARETQNYLTCGMIVLIFLQAVHSLTVFSSFGMLVEAIDVCLIDMIQFIILLVIYLLMFAAVDYVSAPYDYKDRHYLYNFGERYRTVFGESLDIEYFYDGEGALGWISYLLFTIIVHVVMLNLLIHLISESYQGIKSSQKSIRTRSIIDFLLEIGALQRLNRVRVFRCGKKVVQNEEQEKLYYVHRFVTVSDNLLEEQEAAATWQAKLGKLAEKQESIIQCQNKIAADSAVINKNIQQQMQAFSGIINKQTVEIFKRLETQQGRMTGFVQKAMLMLPESQSVGSSLTPPPQYQSDSNSGKIMQQIQQLSSKLTSQFEQQQSAIIQELVKQQEMVREQAEKMVVGGGAPAAANQDPAAASNEPKQIDSSSKPAAESAPKDQSDGTKEYINQQIASLSKSIKVDQQKIQSQMSDVKNQVDQVAKKIGYLENAVNEMKEAREGMANDQERLKDDIYNMLFDQKHQILGSIQQLLDKKSDPAGDMAVDEGGQAVVPQPGGDQDGAGAHEVEQPPSEGATGTEKTDAK